MTCQGKEILLIIRLILLSVQEQGRGQGQGRAGQGQGQGSVGDMWHFTCICYAI